MAISSTEYFTELYRSCYPALCFYAVKIVEDRESARDIVDEVFTKLIVHEKKFSEKDNVRAWLYTATRNASFDYLKLEKHAKERQFEFSLNEEVNDQQYDYDLIRSDLLGVILQEIKFLPGNTRKIIEMSFLKGMRNEQIALDLGLSEKTVRNLKSSGVSILKSRIPKNLFLSFLVIMSFSNAGVNNF